MRRANVIVILLAAATAFAMFVVSYRVKEIEDELAAVGHARATSARLAHVLRADWTYLTRPERLSDLAARNLSLAPAAPSQVVAFDGVPDAGAFVASGRDAAADMDSGRP
ncbi:MAG: cell division protein FtsL [Alphaproteobacteria bacterium]